MHSIGVVCSCVSYSAGVLRCSCASVWNWTSWGHVQICLCSSSVAGTVSPITQPPSSAATLSEPQFLQSLWNLPFPSASLEIDWCQTCDSVSIDCGGQYFQAHDTQRCVVWLALVFCSILLLQKCHYQTVWLHTLEYSVLIAFIPRHLALQKRKW